MATTKPDRHIPLTEAMIATLPARDSRDRRETEDTNEHAAVGELPPRLEDARVRLRSITFRRQTQVQEQLIGVLLWLLGSENDSGRRIFADEVFDVDGQPSCRAFARYVAREWQIKVSDKTIADLLGRIRDAGGDRPHCGQPPTAPKRDVLPVRSPLYASRRPCGRFTLRNGGTAKMNVARGRGSARISIVAMAAAIAAVAPAAGTARMVGGANLGILLSNWDPCLK